MWRTETLQGSLDVIDGHGIRPVFRASPPLAPEVPGDMVCGDRRHQRRRLSDPDSSRARLKEVASAAAFAAVDRLGLAIILLHPDRRVLLLNSAAMRIQARDDCFQISARKLCLTDRKNQHALESFLRDRRQTTVSHPGPLCVSSHDHASSCYYLFAEWLDVQLACDGVVSLHIHEPRLEAQLDPGVLSSLYGLTRMESAVVVALYCTPVLQIAADRCGVSLNTAKTHLKRVFAKCGVHSKAELLRLLALGPRIPG